MNRLLYWLQGRLPLRIISDDGAPYLERAYLGTLFGVRFYLHRFVGDDPARGLHDHPWPWAFSLILFGRYLEETRRGPRIVRWWNWLTGDSFHRVVLVDGPVWSLFAHRAAYVKPWGFLKSGSFGTANFHPVAQGPGGGSSAGEWWKTCPHGRFERRRAPLEGITE
ncbi:MAG: hypothetical protein AB7P94_16920 [Steroidobacteraceae bacterium]